MYGVMPSVHTRDALLLGAGQSENGVLVLYIQRPFIAKTIILRDWFDMFIYLIYATTPGKKTQRCRAEFDRAETDATQTQSSYP